MKRTGKISLRLLLVIGGLVLLVGGAVAAVRAEHDRTDPEPVTPVST